MSEYPRALMHRPLTDRKQPDSVRSYDSGDTTIFFMTSYPMRPPVTVSNFPIDECDRVGVGLTSMAFLDRVRSKKSYTKTEPGSGYEVYGQKSCR